MTSIDWEHELTDLLGELTASQDEMLALLAEKQDCIARADVLGLDQLVPREQQLLDRLLRCQHERERMLSQAQSEGVPADSLRTLARHKAASPQATEQLQGAQAHCRMLYHHSLTQWVLAQRSLLHVSQLLEMLATGGRQRPTYNIENPREFDRPAAAGVLIDQTA